MKNLIGMFLVAATAMLPAHAAEPAARSAAEPDPALVMRSCASLRPTACWIARWR